jgi:hypothetical protein
MELYSLRAASVIGTEHRDQWRNNQDAYAMISEGLFSFGIVCDGCGSTAHAEVGAKLIATKAKQIAHTLVGAICEREWTPKPELMARSLKTELLYFLRSLKMQLDEESFRETMACTLLGFILFEEEGCLFYRGDGFYAVDGIVYQLSSENNAPDYLIYDVDHPQEDSLIIEPIDKPFSQVMVGTDGFEWWSRRESQLLPDQTREIGSVESFLEEAEFDTSVKMQRFLQRVQTPRIVEGSRRDGLLKDDTTLIIAEKRILSCSSSTSCSST